MHIHAIHKLLLMTLLIGAPFSCTASEPFYITHATHLIWGATATASVAVTCGLTHYFSNAKYTHLENEAQRKQQAEEKESERCKEAIAEEKTIIEDNIFEEVDLFLRQFGPLYEAYHAMSPEQLKEDSTFQQSLLSRTQGISGRPHILDAFNEISGRASAQLYAIHNLERKAERTKFLTMLAWYQQQTNNSPVIMAASQTRTQDYYALEEAKHLTHIRAEQLNQEKRATQMVEQLCGEHEQIAEEQVKTSRALSQNAQSMLSLLDRGQINMQGQLNQISQDLTDNLDRTNNRLNHIFEEKLNILDALQATIAHEHTETQERLTAIIPLSRALINMLDALQVSTKNTGPQLDRLETKQTQTFNLVRQINDLLPELPDDLKVAIEKIVFHEVYEAKQSILQGTAQMLASQTSAVETHMSKKETSGFDAQNDRPEFEMQ